MTCLKIIGFWVLASFVLAALVFGPRWYARRNMTDEELNHDKNA